MASSLPESAFVLWDREAPKEKVLANQPTTFVVHGTIIATFLLPAFPF